MTRRRAYAGAALLCAWLTPCFPRTLKTFVGVDVDLNVYKTYQWMPTRVLAKSGILEDDPTLSPIIKAAVNRELTARGLNEVSEHGDLQVITCALSAHVPQLEALIFPAGGPLDYPTSYATMGRYNREGTLAISLVDSRTKKFAWAGMITESIDNKPGAGARKIPKATEALFKKFPIKK